MQKYSDLALSYMNGALLPLLGASVSVFDASGALATIYSNDGISPQANPFLTSTVDGEYSFYAVNGIYSITVSKTGFVSDTKTGVLLDSPSPTSLRLFGAKLDGVTDDLAAFNAAILSIPSGQSRLLVVDGPAYMSGSTTNAGRYPVFEFLPGAGVTATSGGALGDEETRFSWPVRWSKQQTDGPVKEFSVNPRNTTADYARHKYTKITGSRALIPDPGVGIRTDLRSFCYGAGFDILREDIGVWGRTLGDDGGYGLVSWQVAISPTVGGISPLTRWGIFAEEKNWVNRHTDHGWSASRTTMNNYVGGLQLVPESSTFGEPGTTYNSLFHLVICHSTNPKVDGIPAQTWNGILYEANAICGDGFGAYINGNDSGVSGRDPKAVFAFAETWKTGIVTQAATLTTGRALAMGLTHRASWVDASGNELAGIRIGTGTPESVVTAPIGSIFLRTDGGAVTTLYVKTSGVGNTGWTAK